MQVITTREPSWIEPFTGLTPGQFRKLVRTVGTVNFSWLGWLGRS